MATKDQIRQASSRIAQLVKALLETEAMVRGSFSTVYLRCGKSTCWCADVKQTGHVCTRITWTENGISKTRTVRKEDRERLREAVEVYRTYRRNRRELRNAEAHLENLLDIHECATTKDVSTIRHTPSVN